MSTCREALERLSREELIEELLAARGAEELPPEPPSKKQKRQKERRPFDMSRHCQRHVALRIAYIGTAYQGFAWQDSTPDTVEGRLIEALLKVCLISDRKACGLSRGGRTDKGVSALGQVIALRLRSNLKEGDGIIPPASAEGGGDAAAVSSSEPGRAKKAAPRAAAPPTELDYCRMLNRVLPSDIRVLAWRPVDSHFSARFSATHRTYKYFFVRGGLDVARMGEAARRLVGEHDFRNFCKIDPSVSNFRRRVLSVHLQAVPGLCGADADSAQAVWEFTVSGYAFLWHQVRCMVAVLFLVGEGSEEPSIVSDLLDVNKYESRPAYIMASEAPLLLHTIGYEDLTWTHHPSNLAELSGLWGAQLRECSHRAAMYHTMRAHLLHCAVPNPAATEDAEREAAADTAGGHTAPPAGQGGAEAAAASAAAASEAAAFAIGAPTTTAAELPTDDAFVPWRALAALAGGSAGGNGARKYVPLADRPRGETVEAKCKGAMPMADR